MSNLDFDHNFIDSVLTVKASEITETEAQKDLDLPQGKSLSELLNDQKNIAKKEPDPTIENQTQE